MGRIKAGKLDRLVEIQRRGAEVHDGYSRKPGAWQAVACRWASVQPVRGRESDEGLGRSGTAQVTFWFHYDTVTSAITEQNALVYNGQRYEITAPPLEIGRREGIEVYAIAAEIDNASEPAA